MYICGEVLGSYFCDELVKIETIAVVTYPLNTQKRLQSILLLFTKYMVTSDSITEWW